MVRFCIGVSLRMIVCMEGRVVMAYRVGPTALWLGRSLSQPGMQVHHNAFNGERENKAITWPADEWSR